MTLAVILRWILLGLAAILLVALTVWITTCTVERRFSDRPAADIPAEDVPDDRPEADLGVRTIYVRELAPTATGNAPGAAQAEVDSFTVAAGDTAAIPLYVPFSGRLEDDGKLTLWVPKSDRSLERWETEDCTGDCEFGSTPSGGPYAHSPRAIPRLLPQIGKTALVCAGVAAAGAGIAIAADYEEPLLVAGVAGGSCALLKIAF